MSKTILIIDDDQDYTEAMKTLLESKGYRVQSASEGKSGVEKAKSTSPDLIFLDVMMSKKTEGFDTSRELHNLEETSKIPIVMITGIRKEMNVPYTIEPDSDWLPVKAILEKPVKPELLFSTLDSIFI
ncbi:MAG: response regulator [Spirochaetales bacterium]|nr:response regulator [Spirochaetales bacterium]